MALSTLFLTAKIQDPLEKPGCLRWRHSLSIALLVSLGIDVSREELPFYDRFRKCVTQWNQKNVWQDVRVTCAMSPL